MHASIDLSRVDWELLRQQKLSLLFAIDTATPKTAEDLTGILHFLDLIQDEAAANHHIGQDLVFGEGL